MDKFELVSDASITKAYGSADFGSMQPREVVDYGVLKCASGYYQGHTSNRICKDLGLINSNYKLTDLGRQYLWAAFKGETTL